MTLPPRGRRRSVAAPHKKEQLLLRGAGDISVFFFRVQRITQTVLVQLLTPRFEIF